jgi:acyl carrier protein
MERKKILQLLEEMLEMKKLEEEMLLTELENWNSLTGISLIALADAKFNKVLKAKDIDKFKSVKDVIEFLNE